MFERREETRSDLHSDRENEEDETKFFHKVHDVVVHSDAKMAHNDTNKKHESDAERDAKNFDFAEQNTAYDTDREQHNTMPNACTKN